LASDKVNYPEAGSIAQAMKYQIRTGSVWDTLTPAEKESLDQIATAIARMVVGDGAHWDAIIGYAHAAKPASEPAPRARLSGVEAIERSIREIPHRGEPNER
jgi:hypothetical protein